MIQSPCKYCPLCGCGLHHDKCESYQEYIKAKATEKQPHSEIAGYKRHRADQWYHRIKLEGC